MATQKSRLQFSFSIKVAKPGEPLSPVVDVKLDLGEQNIEELVARLPVLVEENREAVGNAVSTIVAEVISNEQILPVVIQMLMMAKRHPQAESSLADLFGNLGAAGRPGRYGL